MNNNISLNFNKERCCGCTACMAICAKHAIQMQRDEQGFLYPVVNEVICVDCGRCVGLCPDDNMIANTPKRVIACRHKNEKEQLSATSGGFATALSQKVISEGGVVYGVAYDDFPHVSTIRVDDKDRVERLKGSKYVQTDLKKTLSEVATDLKSGKQVAYFGTSCHINGLLNYLETRNIATDKLITIDLICHGVPSPKLFEEYIWYISKGNKKVVNYHFRTKDGKLGWGYGSKSFYPTIEWSNGKKEVDSVRSLSWMRLFFSNNCLRPHCYHCSYASLGRAADFTIADYWGLMDAHAEFFTNKGVSLVFCNSTKAELVKNEMTNIVCVSSTFEKAAKKQGNLSAPSKKADTYKQFWRDYESHGIGGVLKMYAGYNFRVKAISFVKKLLNK